MFYKKRSNYQQIVNCVSEKLNRIKIFYAGNEISEDQKEKVVFCIAEPFKARKRNQPPSNKFEIYEIDYKYIPGNFNPVIIACQF